MLYPPVFLVSNCLAVRPYRGCALYDLMRGMIFCGCCCALQYVDVSMVYHYIRGQSVIKLYVIYNVLEVSRSTTLSPLFCISTLNQLPLYVKVFDKLCCAFGQDIFDALFTRITVPKMSDRIIVTIAHFMAAFIYVSILANPLSHSSRYSSSGPPCFPSHTSLHQLYIPWFCFIR